MNSKRPKPKPETPACFTLIELLVVVAIIAVLVAVLLPAMQEARERAREIQSMSNLKQLGICAQMHANDNDDYLPGGGNVGSGSPGPGWFSSMIPYIGKGSYGYAFGFPVQMCPSSRSLIKTTCYSPVLGSDTYYGMTSGGQTSGNASNRKLCRLSAVPDPSRTPNWGEHIKLTEWTHTIYCSTPWLLDRYPWGLYLDVHRNRSNVEFMDGRVKSIPAEEWFEGRGMPWWGHHFAIDWPKPPW